MSEIKYVPKKEVKNYKLVMIEALERTREVLMEAKHPYFSIGIVGSAKRNLVLRKGKGSYDVDIQLMLNGNSFDANYRETIRCELVEQLPDAWSINNSTSVITAILHNEKSFDIALIKEGEDADARNISKLDKNANNTEEDHFIWNKMKETKGVFEKRKTIKGEWWTSLREEYKELREGEWEKDKSDKKPSYALYAEAVNNVYNQKNQGK